MLRSLRFVLCLSLTLLGSGGALAAPPPLTAFFEDPVFRGAALSPDGSAVAVVVAGPNQRPRLVVVELDGLKPLVVASFDVQGVRQVAWVNQQRLVFSLDWELEGPNRASLGPGLYAVNRDGQSFRQLVESSGSFVKAPEAGVPMLPWRYSLLKAPGAVQSPDVWVAGPDEISKQRVGYFKLQRLNTATGRATEVDAPLHAVHWVIDAAGQLVAVQTAHEGRVGVHLRQEDGSFKQVADADDFSLPFRVRYAAPDGTLYATASPGGHSAVFTLDAKTGALSAQPVAAAPGFDLEPQFIANDRKLLGIRYRIDAEVTQWLDADMKALQAQVDARLTSTANRISVPRRGNSPYVLVQAFADNQPTLSYLWHRPTGKLTLLGSERSALKSAELGQTDFLRYKARDGLEIPAYITLPPGAKKKNLPLVVLVHGGPWLRGRSWEFDPEVQFLASRGYAVLEPEFRGSTGYGRRLFEAGFKQWGRAMQDDVADGARWAIAQGIADPKRICIAGASYGGYAALMGLVNDPELFRCGINWVGVTDPQLMFSAYWSDITTEAKTYGLTRLLGDPVADAAALEAVSPQRLASKIKQPLLMAYGAWDVRVPIEHGERMRDALKPHNPQVEWVVYPREGHGWAKPETRIDFWGRVEKFLATHLAAP